MPIERRGRQNIQLCIPGLEPQPIASPPDIQKRQEVLPSNQRLKNLEARLLARIIVLESELTLLRLQMEKEGHE